MTNSPPTGAHPYAALEYGEALGHIGQCIAVPEWDSFVLSRALRHGDGEDAIGSYPLATLARDADLRAGLKRLAEMGLVSLILVPDPFHAPDRAQCERALDVCRPFKTHYLVDPAHSIEPTKHHRDRLRRGMRRCRVRQARLADHLSAWKALYSGLAQKHDIRGAAAFAPRYFEMLAANPLMTTFAAFVGEEIAAMTIWFAYDGVVYNHLTASNAAGYANGANFALYGAAIEHFRGEGVIDLGGGSGFRDDPDDGLAAFKRGFSNARTQALICGAILDRERYRELARAKTNTDFFPAYRG